MHRPQSKTGCHSVVMLVCLLAATCHLSGDERKPQVDASGIKASNIQGADLELMHDHDPQVELENFDLLDGFEVNLFAAEPMLAKPIHMTWGPEGKLWVACSWSYPQLKPGAEPNDKIIVLEDTDGDGRADQSTVFADGLYLPTGLEVANGGVYVAQTPDVVFLQDTSGDGVADRREVVLTGFGIEDSHHSISAWRRGPGGWIYFQEGIFLNTQVETQYGLVRNFNGGVYQYNPATGELRVFANVGVGNPWGHAFDEWGQSFFVDNPRVSYLTPSTGNSGTKIRPMVLLSTEKQCGGEIIATTHFPDSMQGQLLTCRFKSRALIRHELTGDASGFQARILPPLISSRHPNFRPVDCKIGPDGAVYIADWYNPIINHGQHDFRDPRRDNQHGRIWRVTARERPLVERPNLTNMSLPELMEQLQSPDAWTRHYARLVISEHDSDRATKALHAWVAQLDPTQSRYDHHLTEALWTVQNLQQVDQPLLESVLQAETAEARAAGVRVIRYWHEQLSDPIAMLDLAAKDASPRVRLEAILSAGFVPDGRALVAALNALDRPRDRFIDSALEQTVVAMSSYLDESIQFAHESHREFARQRAGLGVDARLARLLGEGKGDPEEIDLIRRQIVRNPTAKTVRLISRALLRDLDSFSRPLTLAMLEAIRDIGRRQQYNLNRQLEAFADHLSHDDPAVVAAVLDVLGAWHVESAGTEIINLLDDSSRPLAVRRAAATTAGQMNKSATAEHLDKMAGTDQSLENRYLAVHGLVMADIREAADAAADLLTVDCEQNDPVPLILQFVSRRGGETRLARAMANKVPHPSVAAIVTNHFNRTGTLDEALAKRFRVPGQSALSQQLLGEDVEQLAAQVDQLGNPARGELIYRRESLACSSCHGIGRVGAAIGPDLAAVGSAATTPYIVDSLLRPDKAIAEHYETYSVLTADGRMRKGILGFQNEHEIVLHEPEQSEAVRILRADIDFMQQTTSLMPSGLVDRLASKQEFLDLTSFVSRLGRPGDYATSVAPVIRKWRIASIDQPASAIRGSEHFPGKDQWQAAYSLVNGELPASEFSGRHSAFIRGFVNVQQAGFVQLQLNETSGLRIWLGNDEVQDLSAPFSIPEGRQTLTFLIDVDQRGETGLRVELVDPQQQSARYQVEGGQ